MGSCLKGIIAALVVVGLDAAQAQNSLTPETEPQEWRQLSPDSRDEMRRQYLDSLAPNERKKLRSLVKRFNSMSPETGAVPPVQEGPGLSAAGLPESVLMYPALSTSCPCSG